MTYLQLTQEERYLITAQLMCLRSLAQISRLLGRHRSTISRELRRNATHHDGKYRAEKAHSYAVARRRCELIPRRVTEPQHIAGELERVHDAGRDEGAARCLRRQRREVFEHWIEHGALLSKIAGFYAARDRRIIVVTPQSKLSANCQDLCADADLNATMNAVDHLEALATSPDGKMQ